MKTASRSSAAVEELAKRIRGPRRRPADPRDRRRLADRHTHRTVTKRFAGFLKTRPSAKLSLASLETLAVIAYKQPVTVPEILEIRGVQSASAIKTLLDKRLIVAKGRKEAVGRPMMYGTSKDFLIQFGLQDLSELPSIEDFEDLVNKQAYGRRYEGSYDLGAYLLWLGLCVNIYARKTAKTYRPGRYRFAAGVLSNSNRTGDVTVNGEIVTELGTKADPEKDHIKVRGKLINTKLQGTLQDVYMLLNKPKASCRLPPTPRPKVGRRSGKGPWQPPSRRKAGSIQEGLIILTNDGDFTNVVASSRRSRRFMK